MKKLVECLPKVTDVTELFKYVREGDTVVIDSCFRISRTLRDLLYIIDFLEDKKVTLISLKENFNSHEATSAMIRNYMNSMVQYEMNLMLERQSEGIRIARELGKYKGR
jgi:DNA invertase Pin-like site-specific DNA recombinase